MLNTHQLGNQFKLNRVRAEIYDINNKDIQYMHMIILQRMIAIAEDAGYRPSRMRLYQRFHRSPMDL